MDDEREDLLMTPGPTAVPPDVRAAMARPTPNPDVEAGFAEFYRSLLEKVATLYGTDDEVLVLGGEGILGLEASVASLLESGEEVLCLANGVYGAGFADFVEMHGGDPTVHEADAQRGFDVEAVKSRVEDGDFTAATMVHCETPTGLLNDLDPVLEVLQDAGVLTVVDAVSSLGGTAVPVEGIDVCLGASQKCLSSPPGLTTVSVSDAAWEKVEATDQDTFYTSLEPWHDPDLSDGPALLPYTHLTSNLHALEASLDRLLEEGLEDVFERHERAAGRCRERGRELGLELFPDEEFASPTVTAFEVDGSAQQLQQRLESDHGVVLATSLGEYADDLLRVGHMGYNAEVGKVERTMEAVAEVLD